MSLCRVLPSYTFVVLAHLFENLLRDISTWLVVVAFLVSLSTKFENTASGMYLGSRFQVCMLTLQLQAEHRALSLTDHSFTTFLKH